MKKIFLFLLLLQILNLKAQKTDTSFYFLERNSLFNNIDSSLGDYQLMILSNDSICKDNTFKKVEGSCIVNYLFKGIRIKIDNKNVYYHLENNKDVKILFSTKFNERRKIHKLPFDRSKMNKNCYGEIIPIEYYKYDYKSNDIYYYNIIGTYLETNLTIGYSPKYGFVSFKVSGSFNRDIIYNK